MRRFIAFALVLNASLLVLAVHELVAIAGLYQTSEAIEEAARNRCTHIYLEDEKLRMEVIA